MHVPLAEQALAAGASVVVEKPVALSLAGVRREAVVADYARSAERIEGVLERLKATRTYGPSLADTSADAIRPVPGSIAGDSPRASTIGSPPASIRTAPVA